MAKIQRALENPSYDSWRLQGPSENDIPLRICKCGAECEQDAWECEECEEKAWKKMDAEDLSMAKIGERQEQRRQAYSPCNECGRGGDECECGSREATYDAMRDYDAMRE